MGLLIAAAGRFQLDQILDTAVTRVDPGGETGGWGVAYCYGNRLESVKSSHPCGKDPDFRKLAELRTDMALICPDNKARISMRELQPFVRRETGKTWAFYHHGEILRPQQLDIGGRLPDSTSGSERYFLYVLGLLDPESPVETVKAALEPLAGEQALSFCLISSEALVAVSWYEAEKPAGQGSERSARGLWLGQGELVRFVTSQPLYSFSGIDWEPLPDRTVLALCRSRRELP
jgi:predicted glutamine amidotransferase